jgi:hypothetical protein
MDDYEEILNKSWDEIPSPQVLPVGSYRLKVKGASYKEAKSSGTNDYVLFVYQAVEPLEDVDADALAELGDYDISQNTLFFRIWIEAYADWDDVRKHVVKHGIELVPGETPKETLARMKGAVVIAWLDQRTYENKAGDTVEDNDPMQFAPVSD